MYFKIIENKLSNSAIRKKHSMLNVDAFFKKENENKNKKKFLWTEVKSIEIVLSYVGNCSVATCLLNVVYIRH